MYPYKLWFHCLTQKSVFQKSQNRLFFIKRIYHKKSTQGNRIGVAALLQGEDLNRCTYNDKTFSANLQVGDTVYVPIELYTSFEL